MQLQLTDEQRAFQQEVRTFVEEKLPAEIRTKTDRGIALDRQDYVNWQRILNDRGWLAPGWPVEHGGTDWTPVEKYIFDEEMARGGTPRVVPFGVNMVAPVIIAFGSAEQKAYYLPRILNCDDWWCQGYSEPGSGSDLASLTTKAERNGDDYIVNGAKTWTTMAQHANMIFCLVRTDFDAKQQEGISFLLIDMNAPGVEVRPIKTMDGGHEINTVTFDNVRVPVENRVGEENKGWTYAKYLLGHERNGIAAIGRSKHQFERLKTIARAEAADDDGSLIEDADFARKMASVQTDIDALEATVLRLVSAENAGHAPGPETSILKIKGTEIQQTLSKLLYQAVGAYAQPFIEESLMDGWNETRVGPDYAAPLAPQYFNVRKTSIYGGSNEIQKNIIAKAVLRL